MKTKIFLKTIVIVITLFVHNVLLGQCWKEITTGVTSSLGIKTDGTLWAWGNNSFGQLGDNTTTTRLTPTQIGTDNDWTEIASGQLNGYAIKTNGTLWSWGKIHLVNWVMEQQFLNLFLHKLAQKPIG